MATENRHNCVYAYWDPCRSLLSFSTGFANLNFPEEWPPERSQEVYTQSPPPP